MKKLLFIVLFIIVLAGCDNPNELITMKYKITYKATCSSDVPATVTYANNDGRMVTAKFTHNFECELQDRHDAYFFVRLSVKNEDTTSVDETVGGIVVINSGRVVADKSDARYIDISGSIKSLK